MQTLTRSDVTRAFEAQIRAHFGLRLTRLEWLADDPYEPTGEPVLEVFHVALHLRDATPEDIDVAADLACQVEEQFGDQFTILSHTLFQKS